MAKSLLNKEKLFDYDLVEEAVSNSWDKFQDKTPEDFVARMLEILDVVDDAHPSS